jgi:alcohol dehydrogenase
MLMLADIGPTGYEVGVLNGRVQPGDVVVVGAGPVGLSAIMSARLFSPLHIIAVDRDESRPLAAKGVGADITTTGSGAEVVQLVQDLTDGLGADVAIEAVGVPETFKLCAAIIRPGGGWPNVGVHGAPAILHLEDLWIRNVTITTGLVDTSSMPTLIRLVQGGRLDLAPLVTHRFALDDLRQVYDVFADAGRSGALKVVLTRS